MRISKRRVSLLVFVLTASVLLITLGAANALYRSAERQPVSYVGDGAMSDYSDEMISETDENTNAFISKKCDKDFFNCRLMKEILKTHKFLQRNENGLPYTDDPRVISPFREEVRLNIDAQANGYLNLYKFTHKKIYLREAQDRLDYIISLGPAALGAGPFDGQAGFTFLYAYELTKNKGYYNYGIKIADACITYQTPYNSLVLNWGYMCAMTAAKAYKITGDTKYLNLVRNITRDTATYQFNDGSFPHFAINDPNASRAGYTYWMIYELLQIREDDPENPDMDSVLVKSHDFLARRINYDGSLNYSKGYNFDPMYEELDPRGWVADFANVAYALKAFGDDEKTKLALNSMFSYELNGTYLGSYSDKFEFPQPDTVWTAGKNVSVLRTSLIFWFLTSIPLIDDSCNNGFKKSCQITNKNCDSSFREFGLCNSGLSGENVCINGRFTGCLNETLITYPLIPNCYYPFVVSCDPNYPYCATVCFTTESNKKCINGVCTACFNTIVDESDCYLDCTYDRTLYC